MTTFDFDGWDGSVAQARALQSRLAGRVVLDELCALAGGARLSIDVLPMCSPEAPTGGTGADEEQGRCDARLSALETRMEQLSGHV